MRVSGVQGAARKGAAAQAHPITVLPAAHRGGPIPCGVPTVSLPSGWLSPGPTRIRTPEGGGSLDPVCGPACSAPSPASGLSGGHQAQERPGLWPSAMPCPQNLPFQVRLPLEARTPRHGRLRNKSKLDFCHTAGWCVFVICRPWAGMWPAAGWGRPPASWLPPQGLPCLPPSADFCPGEQETRDGQQSLWLWLWVKLSATEG